MAPGHYNNRRNFMKKYTLLLIMALLLATGCESSMYRFLYNSMDSFIYRAITWYVEPSPDQDRFIRDKIGTHLQWHRRSELLKYVNTLQGLRERMARGLKKEDINWTISRFEVHETDLFNAVSDDVVSFLTTLDAKQIDRLDERLGDRIEEFESKMNRGTEERFLDAERNTKRIMGFLYGELTTRQEEEIAKGVRGMENINSLTMRMYRERRAGFISFLKNKPDRDDVKAYLRRLALEPEKIYPEYYRGPAERRDRAVIDAILRFDRELVTPAQRTHAIGKIDTLIQVLRELAAG
jgi:hypothetical protein